MAPGHKSEDSLPPQLIEPPLEYEESKASKVEEVKKVVISTIFERTKNTVKEKRSFCLREGLTENEANFVLTKAIQNLQSLLPLNIATHKVNDDDEPCIYVGG